MGFLRGIGLPELLIILFIILLVFGTARLPKLAGSMGKAVREFRRTTDEQDRPSRNGHKASGVAASSRKPPERRAGKNKQE
jgi:sec-independent protein translocase protein TatA